VNKRSFYAKKPTKTEINFLKKINKLLLRFNEIIVNV